MNLPNHVEKCLSFINCHLQAGQHPPGFQQNELSPKGPRAITISRQTGCGAHTIAEKVAECLQAQEQGSQPWAVFDRNLVEKVLSDHHLPLRLSKFMPEDRVSEMADIMDELFGLHPPSWILARKTSETILHLAQLGRVILIGRGANIVTSRLSHVLHVRLVGSLPYRAQRLQQFNQLAPKEALRFAVNEDAARERYVRHLFGKDVNDPLLYHLVIQTDWVSVDECAQLITQAMSPRSLALAA